MTLHGVLDLWFTTELSSVPMHKPIENQCILQRNLGFSRWATPSSLLWLSSEILQEILQCCEARSIDRPVAQSSYSQKITFHSVNQNALLAFLDLLINLR